MAQKQHTRLHYVALEKTLPQEQTLRELNHGQLFGPDQTLYQAFLQWRAELPISPTASSLSWTLQPGIRLEIILGNATKVAIPDLTYDAVYHDPFSPAVNPELWAEQFFHQLYRCLASHGKLATYSAKGTVRRAMQSVGFVVHKQPGPPGKRDIVVATRPPETEHNDS